MFWAGTSKPKLSTMTWIFGKVRQEIGRPIHHVSLQAVSSTSQTVAALSAATSI
jgi:hypothetical protein